MQRERPGRHRRHSRHDLAAVCYAGCAIMKHRPSTAESPGSIPRQISSVEEFDLWQRQISETMWRVALYVSGDVNLADDAAQNTYLHLHEFLMRGNKIPPKLYEKSPANAAEAYAAEAARRATNDLL